MIGGLPDIMKRRAELSPGSVALEEHATGRNLTFEELDERADRVASLLRAGGVEEGDRIALLCRNRIAFFELLFGCAKAGAILVPLNWRMPPAELDQLIEDAGPKLLFHDAEEAAAAAQLQAAPAAIGLDEQYEMLLAAQPRSRWRTHWPSDGIWYLLYTSGTTGGPKGVIYTYRMAIANHVNLSCAIDICSTDTTAAFLPFFHTAGINLNALPTLFQGGRVIVLDGFEPEALVRLLEARRLDTVFAVPTIYQTLLDHPRFASAPLDHVRRWGCGGAPLPDSLVERLCDLGVRVCNGMGMTETGPTAFVAAIADAWDRIDRLASRSCWLASGSSVRMGKMSRTARSAISFSPAPESPRAIGTIRMRPGRPSRRTAGFAPATSPDATPTAIIMCRVGGRRCSFPAARTSIPPKSRISWPRIRRSSKRR